MVTLRFAQLGMLALLVAGCSGNQNSPQPSKDDTSNFTGTWEGVSTLTETVNGQTQTSTSQASQEVTATGYNQLRLPHFCNTTDPGPSAQVTTATAFQVASYSCTLLLDNGCILEVTIASGSGTLKGEELTILLSGGVHQSASTGCTEISATYTLRLVGTRVRDHPVPQLTTLNPTTTVAGGPGFTLTVSGADFDPSSSVAWNGALKPTQFLGTTTLSAQIDPGDIVSAQTIWVTVVTPGPGGGTSNALSFIVTGGPGSSVPTLLSLSPSQAQAGGAGFTLSATGADFVLGSTVLWNGTPRPTSYLSGTRLLAQISAADIATPGTASVAVSTPGAGMSTQLPFSVTDAGDAGYQVSVVNQQARDLIWDRWRGVIYLSVPSTGGSYGNTIATLDPVSATVSSSAFAGSEPGLLSISDDGVYLYAGIDGAAAVQRFVLPALTPDIKVSLGADPFFGPYVALDVQVAPGAPGTIAVSRGSSSVSPSSQGGVVIYDDASPRANSSSGFGYGLYDSLQWGADATVLYAANFESTGFDFYVLAIGAGGVTGVTDHGGVFASFYSRIHFDPGTGLIYGDDGRAVDPATALPAGVFRASGRVAPDSALNRAFFISMGDAYGSSDLTLSSFDLSRYTPVQSVLIRGVSGRPVRLIRWGTDGLAFNTDAGFVYLIRGTFVSG